MAIYFAFSDENGAYEAEPGSKFLRAHPYFCRATCLIQADDYKWLHNQYLKTKKAYGLPLDSEIKWSYLWSLWKAQAGGQTISSDKEIYFLKDYPANKLMSFCEDTLYKLTQIDFCKLIFTVTDNEFTGGYNEVRCYVMHLQELIQRLEMELQRDDSNLGVLFVDSVSRKKDEKLREAYSILQEKDDLIQEYMHIKDSLNLEFSHHSTGVKLADHLAGCFAGALKGYDFSRRVFRDTVYPLLRRGPQGQIWGYGLREVPSNSTVRNSLKASLK